jgi:hypothetical protein
MSTTSTSTAVKKAPDALPVDEFDALVEKITAVLREYMRTNKDFAKRIVACAPGCGYEEGEAIARELQAHIDAKHPKLLPPYDDEVGAGDEPDPVMCAVENFFSDFKCDSEEDDFKPDDDGGESDDDADYHFVPHTPVVPTRAKKTRCD